jgi:hypothetical protein
MSVCIRTIPVAGNPAQVKRPFRWIRIVAVLALATPACGCAPVPTSPFAGASPADPVAPIKRTGYRSTIEPYARQRPVEPAPWREQNERVVPQSQPDR